MNHGAFLVARLDVENAPSDFQWLLGDDEPYCREDPVDFVLGQEIQGIHALYASTYQKLDEQLNVQMPEALIEYNRWALFFDADGELVGFVCFKTTDDGLKLGLLAADGSKVTRAAVKRLIRSSLNLDGVYAEVSGPLERSLAGQVEPVSSDLAQTVLGKPVEKLPDGLHYRREITNVGRRTKVMVGRPHTLTQ